MKNRHAIAQGCTLMPGKVYIHKCARAEFPAWISIGRSEGISLYRLQSTCTALVCVHSSGRMYLAWVGFSQTVDSGLRQWLSIFYDKLTVGWQDIQDNGVWRGISMHKISPQA